MHDLEKSDFASAPTLNVLLSFAQFEREVTGERIRDKIGASKRSGLWVGGRSAMSAWTRSSSSTASRWPPSQLRSWCPRALRPPDDPGPLGAGLAAGRGANGILVGVLIGGAVHSPALRVDGSARHRGIFEPGRLIPAPLLVARVKRGDAFSPSRRERRVRERA